jgi:hypothetical protein
MEARVATKGSADEPAPGLAELKRRLEEIIRRPTVTARDAEQAAEAARALADLLRGEERALRLLRTAAAVSPRTAEGRGSDRAGERGPGQLPLAGLTLHEAAYRVLSGCGWPMHARELGARIKAGGWRHPRSAKPRPDQIYYQLAARLPRHPETFRKLGPNTFGLTEWGDAPPKRQAPEPRLGTFRSPPGQPSARWLAEHPEEWYGDMVKDDRG